MHNVQARPDLTAIAELVTEGSRVLDLGCGTGDLLAYLIEAKSVRGTGIELHEEAVMDCVGKGLTVVQGNLNDGLEDYPDQSVDYVILSQTLHYLNRPVRVLQEMMRVGRQVVVSLPNWGHWRARLDLVLKGRMPEAPILPEPWHGARRWQAVTIADFLEFCLIERIQVVDSVFLAGPRAVKNPATAKWRATTGVFVLQAPHTR